jgi:hypothetical protein
MGWYQNRIELRAVGRPKALAGCIAAIGTGIDNGASISTPRSSVRARFG